MPARLLLAATLVVALPAVGSADFITFTDRAAWRAVAGDATATENFQGFAADTPFRTAPVPFNGFSAVSTGVSIGPFVNLVDVPPYSSALGGVNNLNGTTFFLGGTRLGAVGILGPLTVNLSLSAPTTAFGADFRGMENGEFTVIDVYAAGNVLLGTLDPTLNTPQFNGFVLTGGERATRLVFRSTVSGGPNLAADSFGMDNVALVAPVPEPASVAVFGGLLAIGGLAARWRKVAA